MFIQYVVNITLAVIYPDLLEYRQMDARYVTGYAFLQFFCWKWRAVLKMFAVAVQTFTKGEARSSRVWDKLGGGGGPVAKFFFAPSGHILV